MRFISTGTHGALDYIVGLILMGMPWVLGFTTGGPEQWVPFVLGAGTIVYSLVTQYELSLVALLPMPVHLALDALGGVFLIASPWLFGFADRVFWPFVAIGIFEILASLTTRTVAERTRPASLRP
ncbi:hypothetical protein [Roseomonas sp. BN140053]|uniref:SPW repeat domain-containing protein n=1 Tax=Roseomonas sp. BN140053 TaxID=3391898 RepID=UPI0039E9A661